MQVLIAGFYFTVTISRRLMMGNEMVISKITVLKNYVISLIAISLFVYLLSIDYECSLTFVHRT